MKDPSEINWLGVSEAAAKLYAEKNNENSILELSRGFVNFVKSNSEYNCGDIKAEVKLIHPNAKIYTTNFQSTVVKMLKDGDLNRDIISDELVVIISDKSSVETALVTYEMPVLRFTSSITTRIANGKCTDTFSWKKNGGKRIKWEKGKGKAIYRDSKLSNLLDELECN